jgi:molybdopterin molybdotransferase
MIPVSEARAIVCAHARPGPTEQRPRSQSGGSILRAPVHAEAPAPPYDRVMMDGLALRAAAWAPGARFTLQASVPAGHPPPRLRRSDAVIEVMTGGCLPPGCDAVAPVEWCRGEGSARVIEPPAGENLRSGLFVHAAGSDGAAGRLVLAAGTALGPAELAVAATEGADPLVVNRRPRVHLITTGDEVVAPDQRPGPGQIRGSHAAALSELLRRHGQAELRHRHVPDDRSALQEALAELLPTADMLWMAGGVSRGRWDLTPDALERAGVRPLFHGVAQRPGKPLWFGAAPGCLVFGLPGNPNSALICARVHAMPALDLWRGGLPPPPFQAPIRGLPAVHPGLTCFHPLWRDADGGWRAVSPATSGSLHSVCGSVGIAECPPDPECAPLIHVWSPL